MRGRSNNEQEKKARLTPDFIAMNWSWIGFLTQNSRFGDKIVYPGRESCRICHFVPPGIFVIDLSLSLSLSDLELFLLYTLL